MPHPAGYGRIVDDVCPACQGLLFFHLEEQAYEADTNTPFAMIAHYVPPADVDRDFPAHDAEAACRCPLTQETVEKWEARLTQEYTREPYDPGDP